MMGDFLCDLLARSFQEQRERNTEPIAVDGDTVYSGMESDDTRVARQLAEQKQLIATLEYRLAETEQLLAMAEGRPDGGLPGWTMTNKGSVDDVVEWKYGGPWDSGVPEAFLILELPGCGWRWQVWNNQKVHGSGEVSTVREAVAAAMAAYEKARAGHVAASR